MEIIYVKIKEDIESGNASSLKDYAKSFKTMHDEIKFSVYDDEPTIFTMIIYCVEKIKEEIE